MMSIPEWVFSAVAALAVGALFFYMPLKVDFRALSEEIRDLNSRIRELVPEMKRYPYVEANSIEGKLVAFAEDEHAVRREVLFKKREIDIPDFDKGWSLLFDKFFFGQSKGVLRDVTFSSFGETAVQAYSFSSYPSLIRTYIERCRDAKHVVRFLLVCCPSIGKSNEHAEDFLRHLLKIKYANHRDNQLFSLWRDNAPGERSWVEIMITNERILGRALGQVEKRVDYPFNVYGDFAVSRSVVKPTEADSHPLPHLNILIKQDEIERLTVLFDAVWNESREFKAKVLGKMDDAQIATIGEGKVLSEWSKLD